MTFLRSVLLLPLLISVLAVSLPVPVEAATGDILAVRILENGWQAEVDIEGGQPGGTYAFGLGAYNDPTNANLRLLVTSEGYDENGSPTTRTRTVYGTTFVRQPYPNQNLKDERVEGNVLTIKVALSDFVYADDEAGGAGTSGVDVAATVAGGLYTNPGAPSLPATLTAINNSSVAYPKVIGRFAWPGFERVGTSIPVEAVALQKFAQDGKPVAAVVYEAADQHGNTVAQTVRDMTISTRGTDAHPVQVYRADLPTTGLTQGDVLTVNMRAYPWVGDESSVLNSSTSTDGVAQPSAQLGPLSFVNDKEGTYGAGHALVSASAPVTGGVVYASRAAAEAAGVATGFQSITKAAEAIKAYHAANHGRASAGGGTILLTEGNHAVSTVTIPDLGIMDAWLTITRVSGAQRDLTTINSASSKTFPAQKVKYDGVSFNASGLTVLRGRGTSDTLWLHDTKVVLPTTGSVAGYKYVYLTQNEFTNFYSKMFASTITPLVRGNNAPQFVRTSLYAVFGNNGIYPTFNETGNTVNLPVSENSILAYNTLYGLTASAGSYVGKTNVLHGFAVVGNAFENISGNNPVIQIAADNSASTANHVLIWRNTFVGQRTNVGYNDNGTIGWPRVNWSSKFNIFESWNNKDDTFGTPNANRIGAWTVGYGVGSAGNVIEHTTFRGEFDGIHSPHGLRNLNYVHDASFEGDKTGTGDYHLTAGSIAIDRAPGVSAVLPFDLAGAVVGTTPDAGAYEFQDGPPPPDTVAPTVTVNAPSGELPAGTTTTVLNVATNESAVCTYAGSTLASGDGRAHTLSLSGLVDGQAYSGTVSCADAANNIGTAPVSFSVAAPAADTTAPTVTVSTPSGVLPVGTTETTLQAATDEGATCVYLPANTALASSDGRTHTLALSGLVNGESYSGTVSCMDAASNIGSASVSFSVAEPVADTTAPVVTVTAPPSSLPAGTQSTTLSVTTDETATCAYDTNGGTEYASMTPFTSTNAMTHSVELSNLSNGQSYTYYVRCKDAADNVSTAAMAAFSVAEPASGPVPVLQYTFDGSTLTDTTVTNTSGHGYTGALVGAPARVAGVTGDALEFNGSNYVDIGTSSLGLADSFTVSFRIKRTADNPAVGYENVIARGAYLYPYAIMLGGEGSVRVGTRTAGTSYLLTTQKALIGTWTHVAFVYAGGVRSVYMNGSLVKTDTVTGTPSWGGTNYRTYLGKSQLTSADGIMGAIDDLRIYDQALTATEVANVYAAP